jgi:hypothetical protein
MSTTPSLSPELRELFSVINSELTWLHAIWELFIQLYGTNDEHYEIMNSTAPLFFSIIKTVLFNEFALTLNRLTDKRTTSGQKNSSLEQLIDWIDNDHNAKLVSNLRTKLDIIKSNHSLFRIWRHKKLSHNDLLVALGKTPNTFPGITRAQAEAAIKDITDLFNEFSLKVFDSTQAYEPFFIGYGDGNALMQALKQGGSQITEPERRKSN